MSAFDLNTITENASRFSMRLQETLSEHTRDLTIARSSSATYLDTPEDKLKNIRKQLDSNSDREKLDAMKRLIALISKGRNVSEFFAQVVKNVASHNLEIRKLVYIYLLRYAELEPDLALLSINTFQKDLSDPSPLIRAMALRVLAGIRVPMVRSLVVLAIKKCAADVSPYVRKAAALAIPKCYSLDPTQELITTLTSLLRDRSPLSLGAVAAAFTAICPTRLDLLHEHYRRLCRTLVDLDEWGQIDLLDLLMRYVRVMLPRPLVSDSGEEVDVDLRLLLTSSELLFQSRNPAVVMAVARIFYFCGPPSEIPKIVDPLLRLLHTASEVERVVLAYLVIVAPSLSHALAQHYTRLLVRADDLRQIKKDKMQLLRMITTGENYQALLREFIHYADDADDELVAEAIQAIGYCARLIPEATQQCLTSLMGFIQSPHDVVVTNTILVLKSLVQIRLQQQSTPLLSTTYASHAHSPLAIISRLAYRIDEIHRPKARACVLWLVGQYAAPAPHENGINEASGGPEGVAPWAPDVLRKAAKSFQQETSTVKLQIITLAAKLLVLSPADRTLALLTRYVLALARYDLNFDVRDRGRMIGALLQGVSPALRHNSEEDTYEDSGGVVLRREQVLMVLFEGKLAVIDDLTNLDEEHTQFGTLTAITGKPMGSDNYLPDWLEEGTESSLRDSIEDNPPAAVVYAQVPDVPTSIGSSTRASAATVVLTPSPAGSFGRPDGAKSQWQDLDKFYEDEDEDVDDESDEEESEDEDKTDDEHKTEAEESEEEEDESDGESEEELILHNNN